MKKVSMLLCAGVLMSALCAAFTACNEPNAPNNGEFPESGIKPALPLSAGETGSEVDKEVAAFFDENAGLIVGTIFYDHNNSEGQYVDRCVMINSVEELLEVDLAGRPLEYPDIDFDTHTLVLGQCILGHSGVFLASQNITVEDSTATINLILEAKEGIWEQVLSLTCFWGIYPKIDAETLSMNVANN
jgi:hypothetical protein